MESLIRALQSRLNLPYFNVTPDDTEALKCALLELVENEQLRQRMGQVAQRKALQEHSWDLVALKIENIMYALLDRSAPGKEN